METRLEKLNSGNSTRMIHTAVYKNKKEEYDLIIKNTKNVISDWENMLNSGNIIISEMDIMMNKLAIYRDYLTSLLGYYSLIWQDEYNNEIIEQKKSGVKKIVVSHTTNVASYNVPEKEYLELRLKSIIEIINTMKKMGDHMTDSELTSKYQ